MNWLQFALTAGVLLTMSLLVEAAICANERRKFSLVYTLLSVIVSLSIMYFVGVFDHVDP